MPANDLSRPAPPSEVLARPQASRPSRSALLALVAMACGGPIAQEPGGPAPRAVATELEPEPSAAFVSSYRADAWSMSAFDAGEPPSFFLPIARARAADVRNGFGWLAVDDHVIWLSYRARERAAGFGPPISLGVTPEELCSAEVQAMLGRWDGEPYGLELLHDWTAEQMQCLRGHRPHYVSTSWNQGQSHCDLLVRERLLSDELRGLAVSDCSTASLRGLASSRARSALPPRRGGA